ncbi:MAG: cysteine hydrolase family protein [Candidatus Sulfotelmatobacter sp.]
MISMPRNAALIIVDVQKGFDEPKWGQRNNPDAEQKIAALLAAWRKTERPVFHVQHLSSLESSPLTPRNAGCEIKEIVRPLENEPVFQKHVNSAFIGTQLESSLRRQAIRTVVLVGMTTPHCVSTTARMASNLGFEVYVASDAIAAFEIAGWDGRRYSAEEIHNVSLATLHEEFATVVDSKVLLDSVQQA